eukprot:NODE_2972_length_1077_cov_12.739300_g2726_i0.p1 GENE.NODE_2972_length_1077_cov_12.739300_g2726_i0~~NODE_2972_length_1077_cov_12.739300_g2726_i0.p1  ORF type:complete len:245 (-),score=39.65 NODE_2972_length_1077_cov_12.739300_g2726_i0:257-991(-)
MNWVPLVLDNARASAVQVEEVVRLFQLLAQEHSKAGASILPLDDRSQLVSLAKSVMTRMEDLREFYVVHETDSRAIDFEKQRLDLKRLILEFPSLFDLALPSPSPSPLPSSSASSSEPCPNLWTQLAMIVAHQDPNPSLPPSCPDHKDLSTLARNNLWATFLIPTTHREKLDCRSQEPAVLGAAVASAPDATPGTVPICIKLTAAEFADLQSRRSELAAIKQMFMLQNRSGTAAAMAEAAVHGD